MIYDNKHTMRRELWLEEKLVAFLNADYLEQIPPEAIPSVWSKKWGIYPNKNETNIFNRKRKSRNINKRIG